MTHPAWKSKNSNTHISESMLHVITSVGMDVGCMRDTKDQISSMSCTTGCKLFLYIGELLHAIVPHVFVENIVHGSPPLSPNSCLRWNVRVPDVDQCQERFFICRGQQQGHKGFSECYSLVRLHDKVKLTWLT